MKQKEHDAVSQKALRVQLGEVENAQVEIMSMHEGVERCYREELRPRSIVSKRKK